MYASSHQIRVNDNLPCNRLVEPPKYEIPRNLKINLGSGHHQLPNSH